MLPRARARCGARAASLAYHVSGLGARQPILLQELDRESQLEVLVVDAGLQLCEHQHEHNNRRWSSCGAGGHRPRAHARGAATPVISRAMSELAFENRMVVVVANASVLTGTRFFFCAGAATCSTDSCATQAESPTVA